MKQRREAFFGLIAPIGVDLDAVTTALEQVLKTVRYAINVIRLTDLFTETPGIALEHNSEIERYKKYIAAGDYICRKSGRNDIMALFGIAKLSKYATRNPKTPLPSDVVHVFRQIKRVEEISTLREIYGRNILLISCYSPKADRVDNLVKKMLKNERGTGKSKLEAQALEIIATDEDERDDPNGQRVIECYPYADYVLDCSSHETLTKSAARLINVFFGSPFISPLVDEYCAYVANAASYRSLDLSRQVGAAIFGHNCEVIAMGCNEVPKAGGGTYWMGGATDFRDYALGYDSNQRVREDMTRDALVRLQKGKWLSDNFKSMKPDDLVNAAFAEGGSKPGPLSRSMLKDVIEYGRMVHAEMNALTDAARFRRSTVGATLFCTTMPCHMCTKLIIAAGIDRVVYVQPYGKSLVEELFSDSVSVDEAGDPTKVRFESLKGVTPNGFKMAFHKVKRRKDSAGDAMMWDPVNADPIFVSTFPYYGALEVKAVDALKGAMSGLPKPRPRPKRAKKKPTPLLK